MDYFIFIIIDYFIFIVVVIVIVIVVHTILIAIPITIVLTITIIETKTIPLLNCYYPNPYKMMTIIHLCRLLFIIISKIIYSIIITSILANISSMPTCCMSV